MTSDFGGAESNSVAEKGTLWFRHWARGVTIGKAMTGGFGGMLTSSG